MTGMCSFVVGLSLVSNSVASWLCLSGIRWSEHSISTSAGRKSLVWCRFFCNPRWTRWRTQDQGSVNWGWLLWFCCLAIHTDWLSFAVGVLAFLFLRSSNWTSCYWCWWFDPFLHRTTPPKLFSGPLTFVSAHQIVFANRSGLEPVLFANLNSCFWVDLPISLHHFISGRGAAAAAAPGSSLFGVGQRWVIIFLNCFEAGPAAVSWLFSLCICRMIGFGLCSSSAGWGIQRRASIIELAADRTFHPSKYFPKRASSPAQGERRSCPTGPAAQLGSRWNSFFLGHLLLCAF